MKIIQALKLIKDIKRQCADIRDKIGKYSCDLDSEDPTYNDQKRQIDEWLQSHSDKIKEILRLKIAIQKTNLLTNVTLEVGGKSVTKVIAEWVLRRRELAPEEKSAWSCLTDKGYKEEYKTRLTNLSPEKTIKRRLYFDPSLRDKKIEEYRSEPFVIDSTLEVINAVTDLIE